MEGTPDEISFLESVFQAAYSPPILVVLGASLLFPCPSGSRLSLNQNQKLPAVLQYHFQAVPLAFLPVADEVVTCLLSV